MIWPSQVTICQQCGDRGYSNALVYCVECLNFAVHRYCLEQIPETFEEFVNWVCEDCNQKVTNKSPPCEPNSVPLNKGDHNSPKHVDPVLCKTKSNKKRVATCLDAEEDEDTCHDPVSPQFPEAPTTPSPERPQVLTNDIIGSKPKANKNNPSQQPNEANKKPKRKRTLLTMRRRKKKKVVSSAAKTEEQRQGERTKMDPTKNADLASDFSPVEGNSKQNEDGTNSLEETGEEKRENSALEEICVKNSTADVTMDVVPVAMGDYLRVNEETMSIPLCIEKSKTESVPEKEHRLVLSNASNDGNSDREVSQLENGENYVPLHYLGPAKPVIDPIWRGSFSTSSKKYDTIDGFVAHLSSKACPKVWKEASFLPQSICLEMLPKADVWPKSFQISQPSDESIALYFFPVDKRCNFSRLYIEKQDVLPFILVLRHSEQCYEKVFDRLVEDLMCKELAMRTTVQNAELLVFTSLELPLLQWRFQGKYYLWGVFRGKQASQSPLGNQLPTTNGGTHEDRRLAKTKIQDAMSPLSNSGGNYDSDLFDLS
ncbi:hypothetical protein LguiA_018324 [Lonicera macranthoides]